MGPKDKVAETRAQLLRMKPTSKLVCRSALWAFRLPIHRAIQARKSDVTERGIFRARRVLGCLNPLGSHNPSPPEHDLPLRIEHIRRVSRACSSSRIPRHSEKA